MSEWRPVEIIYADGSRGPAEAAYSGEGWCDVVAPLGEGEARFWVRSDGTAIEPYNPCRLSKPWEHYERLAETCEG